MPTAADYQIIKDGRWRLAVRRTDWTDGLKDKVLQLVHAQTRSKHPQTVVFDWAVAEGVKSYYLKVFHGGLGSAALKDFFRESRAFRFWRQGLALTAAGFSVPSTLAAGELRRFRRLQRAFVVTAKIDGQSLPDYLAHLRKTLEGRARMKEKRAGIVRLARLIRDFHRQGFVHGDLIATNLLIANSSQGDLSVFFMDNDRTGRFSMRLFPSLWKRNLIQLNRMPLPEISLQDRMRFLHAYLEISRFSGGEAKFARWLEQRTRQRRKECDSVDDVASFRQLMRWDCIGTQN